ncbi:MAG: hypothetical protein BWK78_03380 [Thiotrichaceae bacterium IS1]|nr:MAG: hypothetical protein BWK78_03380 [Thiotrichaceae bacterium IS1]
MVNFLDSDSANLEDLEMASWNHSAVQFSLLKSLDIPDKYVPRPELSLDLGTLDLTKLKIGAKQELKPDVCLYPATRRGLSRPTDILRMTEMPLLVIEILSPTQGMYDIKEKFKAYFALGIKSCWLVLPEIENITIYSSTMDSGKAFSRLHGDSEVVDEVLAIRVPLDKIFE